MPTLPTEIWELIIDEVGRLDNYYDREREKTLLQCALVCREWHVRSLHLLPQFTSIRVFCDHRLSTFIRMVRQRPENSQPIRDLRLNFPKGWKVDSVPLRLLGPLREDGSRVSGLLVEGEASGGLTVGRLTHDFFFKALANYHSVQSLDLYHITFETQEHLARLILCLTALQNLSLRNVKLPPKPDPPHIQVPFNSPKPPPKLRELIVDYTNFVEGACWSWLVDNHSFAGLQDLFLNECSVFPFDSTLVAGILASCGNSIVRLQLQYDASLGHRDSDIRESLLSHYNSFT